MDQEVIAGMLSGHEERIKGLEADVQEVKDKQEEHGRLLVTVEKLATTMKHMLEEQKKQGDRLTKLEERPMHDAEKIKWLIITAIISGLGGYLFSLL